MAAMLALVVPVAAQWCRCHFAPALAAVALAAALAAACCTSLGSCQGRAKLHEALVL